MTKKKAGGKQKEHQILGGHTKTGTKFSCLPGSNVFPVSHSNQGVPELIWLAILNKELGIRVSARVVELIALAIQTDEKEPQISFFFASNMSMLPPETIARIRNSLNKNNLLSRTKECLKDFISTYPEFPIKWLHEESSSPVNANWLEGFKTLLGELQDKTSRSAMLMIAQAIYGALASGMLRVPPGVFDNFEEVMNYPNSETSREVGALMRATYNGFLGQCCAETGFTEWSNYFWTRNHELEPIDFANLLRGRP